MRILLVDNYDSYSYNLLQLIASVTGTEPDVVSNDDPVLLSPDLAGYDALVVSPGPGHPGVPGDFGHLTGLLARSRLPILGVCLGHQGLALAGEARVERAWEPRHGWLSPVRHRGRELFAGIPQHFTGVRYHSLAVREPLPPELEATAWAEDGVVMGLRHRSLPRWGVQFHPESACTEHGDRLIANFVRLAGDHAAAHSPHTAVSRPRTFLPTGPALRTGPAGAPPGRAPGRPGVEYRLHHRRLALEPDTEAVFRDLFSDTAHAFWLDSSRAERGRARFSFLGDASGPLAETVRYRAGSQTVAVTGADGATTEVRGSVFDYLRDELERRRIPSCDLPFDFVCGYVGYLGYELRADCGSPLTRPSAADDAGWIFADRLVAVDHERGETHLLCLSRPDPADTARARQWLERTGHTLRGLPRPEAEPVPVRPADSPVRSGDRGADRYLADVQECLAELRAGQSYEVCLTDTLGLSDDPDGLEVHSRLRRINPAPYGAYLRLGDVEAACSSPERFLRVTPGGFVESQPIKGTAPREDDPEADVRAARALAEDVKTRAENLMIVDLLRNDLGRVCEVGSVHVSRMMHVESYATVHQLVSTIRGRLSPAADAVTCVRACFPGGSMTGAPKLRTMEIIDRLEGRPRGLYSGSIGYFGLSGGADLNIVIRTAVRSGGRWSVGAGGAIVLDSDPYAELDEMRLKARAPVRAVLAATAAGPRRREPPKTEGSSAQVPRQAEAPGAGPPPNVSAPVPAHHRM
ncbi:MULTISPECIES: aminodeoxychorismate synthase component I [Streptomyces]|uniref:aminodeoxychorismate synthase component I n=1 Tax=Streptomyces TaxID=1883 RepID=UPI000996A75D|nr:MULTISPECIES: aminodeoxychorismate synthase component I [Streptomyces]MDX2917323.1 aminodeoxychorismate synthase component I [Streptomyces sp. NE06-03C]MDX3736418.1 aminodeoxychorismate synthase component I [Streptomyces sp. ID01-15D]